MKAYTPSYPSDPWERLKTPTEAECPPEHLTLKQVKNIIRQMMKDIYRMTITVSISQDGEMKVGSNFKLVQNQSTMTWSCYASVIPRNGKGPWTEMYPMGHRDPMNLIQRIVGWYGHRNAEYWLMLNYDCMA